MFSGCARCGKSVCNGMCENLSMFHSIRSLYWFRNSCSELVNLAKHGQLRWAQSLLQELTHMRTMCELKNLIAEKNISLIVVAPISVRRVLALQWHTSSLLLECLYKFRIPSISPSELRKLVSMQKPEATLQYLIEYAIAWRNSALTPSQTRIKKLKNFEEHEKGCQPSTSSITQQESSATLNILYVDDVLTTGLSSVKYLKKLRKKLAQNQQVNFHMFTLFRTPAGLEPGCKRS